MNNGTMIGFSYDSGEDGNKITMDENEGKESPPNSTAFSPFSHYCHLYQLLSFIALIACMSKPNATLILICGIMQLSFFII